MAKLYTRTGDDGTTGLFAGGRVSKNHPRVTAYGEVDELNAHIGLAIAAIIGQSAHLTELRRRLSAIQSELFTLGAELATPESAGDLARRQVPRITMADSQRLELWIDEAAAATTPIKTFVLPSGSEIACRLHVCRTICRRAERAGVSLAATEKLNEQIVIYLNRLSDLLFAWARWTNHLAGIADVPWVKP